MNHMNFKRRLAALLSMILTFICVVSVTSPAAHAESMAEPENYVEMLTNAPIVSHVFVAEITDVDALLELALIQYQQKSVFEKATIQQSGMITATQVIEQTTFADGSHLEKIVTSVFSLWDKNASKVNIQQLSSAYAEIQNTRAASSLSKSYLDITILHTVTHYAMYQSGIAFRRLSNCSTKVTDSGTNPCTVSSFIHGYACGDYAGYSHTPHELKRTISSPSSGTVYSLTNGCGKYIEVHYMNILMSGVDRVNFSNGTSWYAPQDLLLVLI